MSPISDEFGEEQNHTHIPFTSEDLFSRSRYLYPTSILTGPTSLLYRPRVPVSTSENPTATGEIISDNLESVATVIQRFGGITQQSFTSPHQPSQFRSTPPSIIQSPRMDYTVEDRGCNGTVEYFTGANGQSAVRWLRMFTRERVTKKDGNPVSAPLWLEEIDGHLAGEAAKWTDQTPAIRHLLNENTIDQRTEADVVTFKNLFLDYFQGEPETPPENTISQIQSLSQFSAESLITYHRRTSGLLVAAGGKDIQTGTVLEPLARSVLDLTIDRFINGLFNFQLRLRMLKYIVDPSRSLKGAYLRAAGELKQVEAEQDLLKNMRAAKKLELWRSMKVTMDQNHGKPNAPSVQAILSQIQLVVAEEEDPLQKFKLNQAGNLAPMQDLPTSQPREVRMPNTPVNRQIVEIKSLVRQRLTKQEDIRQGLIKQGHTRQNHLRQEHIKLVVNPSMRKTHITRTIEAIKEQRDLLGITRKTSLLMELRN